MGKSIDIIIPCHNEEDNIDFIVKEIDKHIKPLPYEYNLIFIDDGSTDNTYDSVLTLSQKRNDVHVIRLSRNFGKEAAISAGIGLCDSDAAIIIDSDLQHPPHLLPSMISEWEGGADVVDAVKIRRQKENIIKRILSILFNKLMDMLTGMDFAGSSDYKLLDKKAIAVLKTIEEKNRFFRGLTNWIGMRHSRIEFKVESRKAGQTKWSWYKLFQLSIDAITSYTSKPLQIITVLGIFTLVFSFVLGLQTLYNKFFGGALSGFTTVILVVLILSSLIMISIGILGIYMAKVYNEVKKRPFFIIDNSRNRRCVLHSEGSNLNTEPKG